MTLSVAHHDGSWNSRISSSILLTVVSTALLLAFVGLYAITAHAVAQRTAEIGIRVALGATRGRIRWLVLRRSLAHVGLGLALGLPCTWVFERQFTDSSSGHTLMSPVNLGIAIGLVLIATVTACAWPATRA